MNVADFFDILRKTETTLTPEQTRELEVILEEYPYFQAARALHLKGLKNLDSYKYNDALKTTAAHTTDREVLFDLITAADFSQHEIADSLLGRATKLDEKEAVAEEIEPNPEASVILGETEEKSPLPQNIKDAEQILDPALFESKQKETIVNDPLQLGKPLAFTKDEKHSFNEWLQLTSKIKVQKTNARLEVENEKKKKYELLDKFLEDKPKIHPTDSITSKINIKDSLKMNQNELMTETLARVYLEQKKYKKAIQAFKILSLKYPEKSGFFADQIRAVKNLQKENE
ncbi:MAG: hypothetical protein HKP38_01175 [Croceitalea sp.]|nr:hypothetical protein [Croceitalea sp.]MBT8237994.1 hypothetical protein [Croceitalea sp.]NNC35199.1 hypothetical protein [Croceitalea sp.]NNL07814.1 hypothetical protein [Croceitalea sp.]NNM17683.1 hypothetical protein [Croceitalea sp.]